MRPMSAPEFDPAIIAPCGMNCGICSARLRERRTCHGCNDADHDRPKYCATCRLRLCDRREGAFCFACAEFPCARLKRLDRRYRTRYGMSEIENLECIRDHGMAEFLEREHARWISDEGVLCVHNRKKYRRGGDGSDLAR